MSNKLYIKLKGIPFIGNMIYKNVVKKQGGEIVSSLAREFAAKSNVFIDMYTYGGCFRLGFNNGGTVYVGRYCSIAENVSYFAANHPTHALSQSALFYNKTFGLDVEDVIRSTLRIGNDVWIGYGVIITPGCKSIGDGAVIGAGSIVTHDVPAYSIYAGNPARKIKDRFDASTVESIVLSKWWEYTPEQIMKYYSLMDNPIVAANKIKEMRYNE